MPDCGRVHTPIVSEKQRRMFYHWKGHPEDKPEGITGKEVKGHLKEVEGEKLPKKTKKFMGFVREMFKGGDMENRLTFFVPISKVDEDQRMVYGIATCETLDKQNEIVDFNATKEALNDYSEWRNIREMHKPSAVGIAPLLELRDADKSLYIGAKIVDDQAWTKCKEGVYKGFSIGGEVLDRRVEVNKSTGKPLNRVTKYVMNEISVVDRPANPACKFQTVKRDTTIETITITEDPLKAESVRVMEKAITLAKRILSKEDLEKLPDEVFGLIKIVSDGDKLVKHRQYPMPDRVHAINMIKKMVGADELSSEDKERIHQTALLILGKKHSETECPYCINQKLLKGGVTVADKVAKQVTVTDEPKKKTVTVTDDKPADEKDIKPAADAVKEKPAEEKKSEAVAEKPAEEQKPHIKVEEEEAPEADAKVPNTDAKLDRVISLLEELVGIEEEEEEEEKEEEEIEVEENYDEEASAEDEEEEDEEDEEAKAKVKPAEEEEDEQEEEDDEAKAKVKPADEACKVVKLAKSKKVKKGLLRKLRAVIEPLAKENKELRARLEKLEKQPLPRKEGATTKDVKATKVEKYQEVKLEKNEVTFSEELTKDITKASDLRKSGKTLTKEEESFCQRVAGRMLEEKLSK